MFGDKSQKPKKFEKGNKKERKREREKERKKKKVYFERTNLV